MLYYTSTYYKIKAIKTKIKNIQGGWGAGKNMSIMQILIEKALEKRRLITVMTNTYDNLKDGAIKDAEKILLGMNINFEDCFNKSSKELKINNSTIQFRYISDNKSTAGKSKRRDILYINEANKIGWTVASSYIGRTHDEIYIDYNPDIKFWAHTEIPKIKDKEGNKKSDQIIVTYIDNEMLPQNEVDFLESMRSNKAWWLVYGEGQIGTYSERMIYPFQVIKEIPENAIRLPSAMDFGKSPDPCVLMNYHLRGNDLYIDEGFIANNLLPEKLEGTERMSIVDKLEAINYPKNLTIIGDSSGRTELLDLAKHHYVVKAIKKGPGSRLDGMKKLQLYNIYITRRSTTTIDSFSQWLFDEDPNGKIIPGVPKGHEPDVVAASRYLTMGRPWWEYLVPKTVKEEEQ